MSSGSGSTESPLRVLFVTGAYFPEISSGGLQCQDVARQLRDRIDAHVLTTAVDPGLPARSVVDGVSVSRVAVNVRSRFSKLKATLRMVAELLRIGRRVQVVHLHGYSQKNILVSEIARWLRLPVVLSLHTAGFDDPAAIASHGWLARRSLASAGVYLPVSPHLADACMAAGISPAKIRQTPNGVDLERFSPPTPGQATALRRSLGLDVDLPAILFVGFFSREKQPQVLFDAWLQQQRDPSLHSTLQFVGAKQSSYFEVDESLAADMRTRAVREGVGDRLLFIEPTHRIHDYYRAATVFALPSSREGLPIALLEAMATGLPVVASRLPGATDIVVDHGINGLLVPPGDVGALADALRTLLTDRARAASLGAAARLRVVRDYGSVQTASRWLDAYRALLDGPEGRSA